MRNPKYLLTALLMVFTFTLASAQVIVKVRPTAPKTAVRVVKPGPDYIYIAPSWTVKKGVYAPVVGRWVKARPGFKYVPGKWVRAQGGWTWRAGVWQPVRRARRVARRVV